MLKLILKNLWARRVRNAWLLAELILVTGFLQQAMLQADVHRNM